MSTISSFIRAAAVLLVVMAVPKGTSVALQGTVRLIDDRVEVGRVVFRPSRPIRPDAQVTMAVHRQP